jgi:hypothetical protein
MNDLAGIVVFWLPAGSKMTGQGFSVTGGISALRAKVRRAASSEAVSVARVCAECAGGATSGIIS